MSILTFSNISLFSLASTDFGSLVNHDVQINTMLNNDTQRVSIPIFDNDEYEADKTFTVQLNILESDFDNIIIEHSSIQIHILEDEGPPKKGIQSIVY